MQRRRFAVIIEREGDGYGALCPELDVASRGDTAEGARRLHTEVFVTRLEVAGQAAI